MTSISPEEELDFVLVEKEEVPQASKPKSRGKEEKKNKSAGPRLYVKLIKGTDLISKDFTGKSDPFVVLHVGEKKKKSSVKIQTLNPRWNQYFNFTIANPQSETLTLEVFDKDFGSQEFMGKGTVQLNTLTNNVPTQVKVALNTKGTIKLLLTADGFGKEEDISSLPKNLLTEEVSEDGSSARLLFENTQKTPVDIYQAAYFKEGDIILFRGDDMFGRVTQTVTRSKWDHLGIVVYHKEDDHLNSKKRIPRILEAVESGVKVYPNIVNRFEKYHAELIAVRRPTKVFTPEMHEKIQAFVEEMEGRPYEKNFLELAKAAGVGENKEEDLSSLFCSELVASCYQRLGLLPMHPPSNHYKPKDFSTESSTLLPLLDGVTLQREIYVSTKLNEQ